MNEKPAHNSRIGGLPVCCCSLRPLTTWTGRRWPTPPCASAVNSACPTEQYGNLEAGFGWAFAVGSLFFGFLADKVSVRWLYAGVVLLWSAMGFASGFVENYDQLLVCRTLLGFFEAGHWPCGIKTVRALLDARGRAMGNSVLQSGTSIGAIATPLIMSWLLTDNTASWRLPFQLVGAVGVLWVVAWLVTGPRDISAAASDDSQATDPWWRLLLNRRMLIILVVVALINTTWQLLRAWLPQFLQEGRGYAEHETFYLQFGVVCRDGCRLPGGRRPGAMVGAARPARISGSAFHLSRVRAHVPARRRPSLAATGMAIIGTAVDRGRRSAWECFRFITPLPKTCRTAIKERSPELPASRLGHSLLSLNSCLAATWMRPIRLTKVSPWRVVCRCSRSCCWLLLGPELKTRLRTNDVHSTHFPRGRCRRRCRRFGTNYPGGRIARGRRSPFWAPKSASIRMPSTFSIGSRWVTDGKADGSSRASTWPRSSSINFRRATSPAAASNATTSNFIRPLPKR